MIQEIQRIAELQLSYSSENTPEMKERGRIIRRDLPELLRGSLPTLKKSIGRFADDLKIEGSDGIGRKTEAPWVRVYSESLSPSATTGFYLVIHFALDGGSYFVTLGCGASKWDSERGDLNKYSDEELNRKVGWALDVLKKAGQDTSDFPDTIAIGSKKSLPRSFEKATILAKTLSPQSSTLEELIDYLSRGLGLLTSIYEAYSQRADLSTSEASEIDIQAAVSPNRRTSGQRQGYGLTGPERKAVELQAMAVTRTHLKWLGYKVTDTSANNPFDYLAELDGEAVKVEVKGTTSTAVDSILMTSNEVDLHTSESGTTALAIVSGITLSRRGSSPKCSGGELEFHLPWDISEWTVTPKAFSVTRTTNQSSHNKAVLPTAGAVADL